MTRSTLSSTNRAEVTKSSLRIAEFIELNFPSGVLRLTTADRNIVWGGFTWLGNAVFKQVGLVAESADLKSRRIAIKLSGLDTSLITKLMSDNYSFAIVKIYVGFLDTSWQLLTTPHTVGNSFLMSNATIALDAKTGGVELSSETWSIFSQRDSAVLATPQSQKLRYPGDTGQDRMAYILSQVIEWGGVAHTGTVSPPRSAATRPDYNIP